MKNEDDFDEDFKRRVKRLFQLVRSFPIDFLKGIQMFKFESIGLSINFCSLIFAKEFFSEEIEI